MAEPITQHVCDARIVSLENINGFPSGFDEKKTIADLMELLIESHTILMKSVAMYVLSAAGPG